MDRFPLERIPEPAARIARRLLESGHEAWFVGGAVRDVLLSPSPSASRLPRFPPPDFDIATSALPAAVRRLFPRTVAVGIEHGTVRVLDEDGVPHEVTTFRRDVTTDGRHAVVAFGVSLDEDLARRDFTINAIAVHPETGEIRDPFGGRRDLAERVVRAVGDAATRFREDRLRILRALRFAGWFGFAVQPATWEAAVAATAEVQHLSRERVRDEWLKSLAFSPSPGAALRLWQRAGALAVVWPELAGLGDDAAARLDAVDGRDPVLLSAALFRYAELAPTVAGAAAARLRLSNKEVARVTGTLEALAALARLREAEDAGGPAPREATVRAAPAPPPLSPPRLRRWLSRAGPFARDAAAVTEPPEERGALLEAIARVEAAGDPLAVEHLAVDGHDLTRAGIAPGRQMGALLRRLLDEVLDDPARNTREYLLIRAREIA